MGPRAKTQEKATLDDGVLPSILLDAFIGLLDAIGCLEMEENNERSELANLLRKMEELLSTGNLKSENSLPVVVQLEDYAADARYRLDKLNSELEVSVSEAVDSRTEIMELVLENKSYSGLDLLSRSILSLFKKQIVQEKQAIAHCENWIDRLYSRYDMKKSMESNQTIEREIEALGRHVFKAHPLIQAGISIASGQIEAPIEVQAVRPCQLPHGNNSQDECDSSTPKRMGHRGLWEALNCFIEFDQRGCMSSHLVVGCEGYGKTHVCTRVRTILEKAQISVFSPRLPIDFLESTVGGSENSLISLFSQLAECGEKAALILDNADLLICGNKDSSSKASHTTVRLQRTLLGLLDNLTRYLPEKPTSLFLLFTSSNNIISSLHRFDTLLTLSVPTEVQRKFFISESLSLSERLDREAEDTLAKIVESTSGRNYSELQMYCRQVLQTVAQPTTTDKLSGLKVLLQSTMPQSLQSGALDDFVDVRIWSSSELSSSKAKILFGQSIGEALKKLQSSVIVPLCRTRELDELMGVDSSKLSRSFVGGLLLSGPAGVGKSALAHECGRLAASVDPTVKLLEVACTSLVHAQLGSSEAAIHRLFQSARQAAPCILILDGIENIAAVRGNDTTSEGTMDRVLSTLLVELDGIDTDTMNSAGVAVIGITCNANWVDPALLRPGRLENVSILSLPDLNARRAIARRNLEGVDDLESTAEQIAKATDGKPGASVTAICCDLRLELSRQPESSEGRSSVSELLDKIYRVRL